MLAAVTTGARKVELLRRPVPAPLDGEVLVEVTAVSVCGTDAHIWSGDYPSAPPPLIQGHEICGYAGDTLVVVEPAIACGGCHACEIGRSNACSRMVVRGVHSDGALCEAITVSADQVHPVAGLPSSTAVLVEPASIALQAVDRSKAKPGEYAFVFGCGPVGLLAVRALAERGVHVAAVDRIATRAESARRFGAELVHVADPHTRYPDPRQQAEVEEWAGGEGPSVVLEATGAPDALSAAIDMVTNAGTVVAVGISMAEVRLPMTVLPYKELDLLGSRNSCRLFPAAVEFVMRNRAFAEELITHRFALADTQEAFALAHDGGAGVGKIVIEVGRS